MILLKDIASIDTIYDQVGQQIQHLYKLIGCEAQEGADELYMLL